LFGIVNKCAENLSERVKPSVPKIWNIPPVNWSSGSMKENTA
jgi:hypothetical protein